MPQASLEARIARLEATEDIRRLKAVYCLHCDHGYAADEIAALFTADAVWDGGERGRFEGREAIRQFFAAASAHFPYAAHLVTNPIIEVDGDRATGQWRMIMPCTMKIDGREACVIQIAEYDESYRRDGGTWRIERLAIHRRRLVLERGNWDPR